MTPFARYVYLLDKLLDQRIPDDPEAKQALARRMQREGMSVTGLATRFGVTRMTMRAWLNGGRPRITHSQETRNRFLALRKTGLSIRRAAAEMGLSRKTVESWR